LNAGRQAGRIRTKIKAARQEKIHSFRNQNKMNKMLLLLVLSSLASSLKVLAPESIKQNLAHTEATFGLPRWGL
jgi:hypothetical protein